MDASQLYREGKLAEALQAQTSAVKANATDTAARTFFFELLCFDGQLARAATQLDTIEQLDSTTAQAVQVYRNILHAEETRSKVFHEAIHPGFLTDPGPEIAPRLEALSALVKGDADAVAPALAQAEELQSQIPATIDGQTVEDLRDCDDLIGPVIELIVLRDYIWLPLSQLSSLDLTQPERPRDLIWAPVSITLRDGRALSGYSPTRYPDSSGEGDELALGRQTDWYEAAPNVTRGKGLRLLLAGEEGIPYLPAHSIQIADS